MHDVQNPRLKPSKLLARFLRRVDCVTPDLYLVFRFWDIIMLHV